MRLTHGRAGIVGTALVVASTAAALLVSDAGAGVSPGGALQRDADAVRDAGAIGVLAELRHDGGSARVRSGRAALGSDAPPPPRSPVRIGSASKTFTATLVLQLVGEGRIGLEDTVESHLPGVVRGNGNDGRRITVRRLLQHTSGLPQTFDLPGGESEAEYTKHRFDFHSPRHAVDLAMKHPPSSRPGTGWEYSNTNYALAVLLVEKVTGNTWDQELSRRITIPLALTDTYAPGNTPYLPGAHMRSYRQFAEGGRWTDTTDRVVRHMDGEGSLVSTPSDVNRFLRALLDGELLRPAELHEMQRTVKVTGQPMLEELGMRYGLGLMRFDLSCGGHYWTHFGDVLGTSTRGGVTEDGDRAVTVAATGNGDHLYEEMHRDAFVPMIDRALCGAAE